MRRKEKEITDRAVMDSIIRRCAVCRLAVSDGDQPYVIPLNFGYDGKALYFHCAREGRKIEVLRKNNKVCFVFDTDHEMIHHEQACHWAMKYSCVIGTGRACFIEGAEPKSRALDLIMKQYSDKRFSYADKTLEKTLIIKIDIETLSGKASAVPEDNETGSTS